MGHSTGYKSESVVKFCFLVHIFIILPSATLSVNANTFVDVFMFHCYTLSLIETIFKEYSA